MGIYTYEPTFSVVCDGDNCFKESDQESSEREAEKTARDCGWEEVDGKWFCDGCAAKTLRSAKRKGKP